MRNPPFHRPGTIQRGIKRIFKQVAEGIEHARTNPKGRNAHLKKYRILVIDDDPKTLKILQKILANAGYDCITATDGEMAIKSVVKDPPDLIILDKMTPGMNGIVLSCEIKKKPPLSQVPILMLTAACSLEDKISALESCVDDYFCKPFSASELTAKIKAILRHNVRLRESHPTTNLPGGNALEEEVQRRIQKGDIFALMHIDIDNFKAYADSYGFNDANKMIELCGKIITKAATALEDTFISHVGGDDFIVITGIDKYESLAKEITKAFDRKVTAYFRKEDILRGAFTGLSRKEEKKDFPITTISIGIISNEKSKFHDTSQTSILLARAKNRAKHRPANHPPKSTYYFLELQEK